ncbi:CvpA family protein [Paludicola sp. MB14-C6]|uniref:CvpA family protein n=1 Tax=Paludihabitans sp. MB14-C6 TaxID=3070656 RepID=UPI0027DE9ED1|nr:CvpA family protein [Paludicola sp. MB14-C6]WMJ23300.1 CvpA family protein [Paludicola sp. MB14-C6]
MSLASIIMDIIIIAVVLFIVMSAYRKGFLRSAILTVGYFVSIFVAIYLSKIIGNFLYDTFIRQQIITSVNKALSGNIENIDIAAAIPIFLAKLPVFLTNSIYAYFGGKDAIISNLGNATSNATNNISIIISDQVVEPIVLLLLNAILSILLFLICIFIVKRIAKLFQGFYAIPVIGPINSFFGGVLGVIQAIIVVVIIAILSKFVISLTGNTLPYFNTKIIDSTYIFKIFYHLKFI